MLELTEILHDVDHLLFFVETAFFGQIAELYGIGTWLEMTSFDSQFASGWFVNSEQCADCGRLARAVAAQKTEYLTLLDVEREIVDDSLLVKLHFKMGHRN